MSADSFEYILLEFSLYIYYTNIGIYVYMCVYIYIYIHTHTYTHKLQKWGCSSVVEHLPSLWEDLDLIPGTAK
jgi:hypothetical protein